MGKLPNRRLEPTVNQLRRRGDPEDQPFTALATELH
jgi:hypothetical protein